MKKNILFFYLIFILSISIFVLSGCGEQTNSEYNVSRTETQVNDSKSQVVETELYKFSTPINSTSENRLTNIKITCGRINETIVKQKEEFSFCDVVGKPSTEDGYKEADAYGPNNEIIKSVGGGNCQVSTTLYNAALGVDGLKVTERHEHDRDVSYVEDGKDATIAYDYLDLKFENNNDFDIKIYATANKDKVTIKIYKIS